MDLLAMLNDMVFMFCIFAISTVMATTTAGIIINIIVFEEREFNVKNQFKKLIKLLDIYLDWIFIKALDILLGKHEECRK